MKSFTLYLSLIGLGIITPCASAAVEFHVNTTKDEIDFVKCTPKTPKNCSLRSALLWSNQLVGMDTITLPAGVFPITRLGTEPQVNPELMNDFNIVDSVILRGAGMGKTIIDGMGKYRILQIDDLIEITQVVVIEDITLRNGWSGKNANIGSGVGINAFGTGFGEEGDRDALTLRRVRLTNNVAEGQLVSSPALDFSGETLLIEDSQIDHNHALAWNGKTPGGGLMSATSVTGSSFVMRRTRIHDNVGTNDIAECMTHVIGFNQVWWDRMEVSNNSGRTQLCVNQNNGTTLLSNSTFSGNSGDVLTNSSALGLLHVTMVDNNTELLEDRAIWNAGVGKLWMKNTIIANPLAAMNCDPDSDEKMFSLGNNIVSDDSCLLTEPSDLPNTDPKLGPLQFNGGTSRTHMPQANSIAVDGGETLPEVTGDQRGQPRPAGKSSDIGAVERGPILSIKP